MSDHDAKDMEDFQESFHASDGELEHKHELINEASNEAEDVEGTIDEITDALRQVGFTGASAQHTSNERTGQKTIELWLTRDNLVVYPVWIGNLPRETAVPDLRRFLEKEIGRVLISVHISPKRNANERTYAFLNLPTAEKQILAVTLLDGTVFHGEKLIVRSKRPSKFPQSFFGSSPISDHFKHFRDCVVPAILAAPTVNLNVHAVKRIMEEHNVGLDHLPNRVWCVQCTLTPNCHRTYCSFYHNQEERELGRIISILAAQNCNDGGESTSAFDMTSNDNGDMLKRPVAVSRHTLLIEGLPKSVSTQKLTEMFEVFGEIDHVIVNPNNTCFLRMKRSQDARKIVHLLNMNNSGIQIQFAPYATNPHLMSALRTASMTKRSRTSNDAYATAKTDATQNTAGGRTYQGRNARNANRLTLNDQGWSHDSMDTDVTNGSMPSMVNQFGSSSAGAIPSSATRQSSSSKPTLQTSHSGHTSHSSSHRRHGGGSSGRNNNRNQYPSHSVVSSHHTNNGLLTPGYAGAMPHAPPPPAALFKEDDMPSFMRPQHPHAYHSVSSSAYDHYMDERGLMTPTDYRGYNMMGVGYGTPTATADWGGATTPMGYPAAAMGYNYPPYYPYHHPQPGLPQLSHISASDPIPYQHGGFGGYPSSSSHHVGYQREQQQQASRHSSSRHGRRHLDQHAHYSGRSVVSNPRQHVNAPQIEAMPPPAPMQPMQSSKPSKGSRLDSSAVQDILNDIPGL